MPSCLFHKKEPFLPEPEPEGGGSFRITRSFRLQEPETLSPGESSGFGGVRICAGSAGPGVVLHSGGGLGQDPVKKAALQTSKILNSKNDPPMIPEASQAPSFGIASSPALLRPITAQKPTRLHRHRSRLADVELWFRRQECLDYCIR